MKNTSNSTFICSQTRRQQPHLVLRLHPHAPQGVLVEPLEDVPAVAELQQASLRKRRLQGLAKATELHEKP